MEFHNSRPLPSRISFYYPVANSIDFSRDYWKRYESLPLKILLKTDSSTDSIGLTPFEYSYSPNFVKFEQHNADIKSSFVYEVCDDLPVLVLRMTFQNLSDQPKKFELTTTLQTSVRTSHSFLPKNLADVCYLNDGAAGITQFNTVDTDSTAIFIVNDGERPVHKNEEQNTVENPCLEFDYSKTLKPNQKFEIIQLIGSCRNNEISDILLKARESWRQSVLTNHRRVIDYSFNNSIFQTGDEALQQTMHWSKAVLAGNLHYIDNHFLPMPCPAEYNFFFTHDLLLTSLGAVNFDPDYVKTGLQFVQSLTGGDSVLAHACYWKDDRFVTEFCNSDNWNNLWFIIVTSAYLKHSNDHETVEQLFPILHKSLNMMLSNLGDDGLMYANRPDWWDIGRVYGARAYITTLMYRAVQDYIFISSAIGNEADLSRLFESARLMKNQLQIKLWDEKAGYLMNMLDENQLDTHYYCGSLVAAYYNLLDEDKSKELLKTARQVLLDEKIGIRNAIPMDFDELIPQYKFNGMEAGEKFYYFNGGVWPHCNAWYALGLISTNQPNEAFHFVKKYMTLDGILNSPNGQPSFYEYRVTNPDADNYGEIDKPTFLWAGGWYLNVLYQLAGLRENSWNIYFCPDLPDCFDNVEYDATLLGETCRVNWKNVGKYFKRIVVDGKRQHSAIISYAAEKIVLERGNPETPYLASASCKIEDVSYSDDILKIDVAGIIGQCVKLEVVSPFKIKNLFINDELMNGSINENILDNVMIYRIKYVVQQRKSSEFKLQLEK